MISADGQNAMAAMETPTGYRLTEEWREKARKAIVGRKILDLYWDGTAECWVLCLSDGHEIPILLVVEERG